MGAKSKLSGVLRMFRGVMSELSDVLRRLKTALKV